MGRLLSLLLAASSAFAASPEGMVLVPAGSFTRGRTFEWNDYSVKWYPNPAKDDLPARKISLSAFWIDQTEVTNERYATFVTATGHRAPYHWRDGKPPENGAQLPVTNVSWDDAVAFCRWDGDKRLPTEAEWERAARGTSTDIGLYPWGDRKITSADAVYNQIDGPQPVCSKPKNAFGLCDVIGNVWEWCSDWYSRTYYADSLDQNPTGPDAGLYKVLRGGSWFDVPPLFLTTSYRSWAKAHERSPTIGMRCAKDAQRTGSSVQKL
jgi:formylglycine-generating enzyme required for sulfatase activity